MAIACWLWQSKSASGGAHSRLPTRNLEHLRAVAQIVALPRKCGVYKECVGSIESAVCPVDMSKDMDHRLYPVHSVEKLMASLMQFRAGSLVQDAIGWAVGHKNVGIVGYQRI